MSAESTLDADERQRLQAQYAEIASLAGGLAHEIKNPLSTILLNLELMQEDAAEDDSPRGRRLQRKIETVEKECHHLHTILQAFLQFARVGQLELIPSDLNRVVEDFIAFYQPQAEEREIEISPHLEADLPPVGLDQALMRQVLMNLTLNAEQAMPEGGLLELQTFPSGKQVCLSLIDTGTGMNEETAARIFQTFYSTKPGGSGLGLPTVRKIVEAHGGTIECESAPGRGTRFTICLPALEDQP